MSALRNAGLEGGGTSAGWKTGLAGAFAAALDL
jgi:hypothetical protein